MSLPERTASVTPDAPSESPYADVWPATGALRLACAIAACYLVLTIPATLSIARSGVGFAALVCHAGALLLTVLGAREPKPGRMPRRDWAPLVAGPFLYIQLRWVIAFVGRPHQDSLVALWEHWFFPSDPSRTLATRYPVVWLSEALHFSYLAYYALIYLPPALLYFRRKQTAFAFTALALTAVYTACFVTFVLFPVDGPRFLYGPAAAPAGTFRDAAVALLAQGSSRGTAFPSSHVAASVVATLCALRFQALVGTVVLLLTAGLTVGAVYGGFHYGVDALAGLITGVVCYLATAVLYRWINASGTTSAGSS